MKKLKMIKNENLDLCISNLEKEWRKPTIRLSEKKLLEIFPEAKPIIPEKIKEWEQKKEDLEKIIKEKLTIIEKCGKTKFGKWFYREWVKVDDGQELLKTDKHISRLTRLLFIARGRKQKGRITEEQIQQALAVPIETLISQPLRKSGRAFIGLCPFHNEKRPSFFIYPETNSFYCYGCQKGGNVINFVEKLYGFSFRETVKFLLNNF